MSAQVSRAKWVKSLHVSQISAWNIHTCLFFLNLPSNTQQQLPGLAISAEVSIPAAQIRFHVTERVFQLCNQAPAPLPYTMPKFDPAKPKKGRKKKDVTTAAAPTTLGSLVNALNFTMEMIYRLVPGLPYPPQLDASGRAKTIERDLLVATNFITLAYNQTNGGASAANTAAVQHLAAIQAASALNHFR